VNGGDIMFYLCDENSPEIHHIETTHSVGDAIFFGLPYRFTEFPTPAVWTLKFYNPSQNTSVSVHYELINDGYLFSRDPFSDAVFRLLTPTIAMFSVWIVWGVITLAAYESEVKRLRPKIDQRHDMDNQEPEDYETHENHDDSSKYKRIRDRR
jgi:hypothetical protein